MALAQQCVSKGFHAKCACSLDLVVEWLEKEEFCNIDDLRHIKKLSMLDGACIRSAHLQLHTLVISQASFVYRQMLVIG